MINPPSRSWRVAALAAHLALIAGLLLLSQSSLTLVGVLILLAPLAGLVRGREYTYAWASMLLAFYCALLLADGYARPDGRDAAFVLAGIAALEFVALNLYVRVRARERALDLK